MTSPFDPTTFAQMTFNKKASTESFPVPVGEHVCVIEKSEVKAWASKEDPSKNGLKVEFTLVVEDAEKKVQEATGREKNTLRYEIMLDLLPQDAGGGLDFGKGKNVRLGRLQEAAGIQDGQPWSFDTFVGRRVVAKVKHEPYKEQLLANVESVRAA